MTRPPYKQALADAGVGLDELEQLQKMWFASTPGTWMSDRARYALEWAAIKALPILIAGLRSETARAEALRVERDEAKLVERAGRELHIEDIRECWATIDGLKSALAEAQRQADEVKRTGWIEGRDAAEAAVEQYVGQTDDLDGVLAAIRALAPPSASGSADTEGGKS